MSYTPPKISLDAPQAIARVDELVGNTQLVLLASESPEGKAPIYLKMENTNPSGSIRDRYIAEVLQRSVDAGQTMAGDQVAIAGLDDSAVSAALLGGMLGLEVHVFTPHDSCERLLQMIDRASATLHFTPDDLGLEHATEQAASWARVEPDRLYIEGFRREAVRDSYRAIAQEILLATGDKKLGSFITSVSTGGTFKQVAPYLREHYPDLTVGGAVLIDIDPEPLRQHDRDVLERIDLELAWSIRDEVARHDGFILGPKGAACVALARQLQEQLPPDEMIIALNPDAGQRYLGWEHCPLFKTSKKPQHT